MNLGIALSLVAGASTLIGAIPLFFVSRVSPFMYALGLAFSAGSILYISLVEFFGESVAYVHGGLETTDLDNLAGWSYLLAVLSFLLGWILCAIAGPILAFCVLRFDKKCCSRTNKDPEAILEDASTRSDDGSDIYHLRTMSKHSSFRSRQPSLSLFNIPPINILGNQSSMEEVKSIALLTTVVLAIHNLPEGVITYITATADSKLGISAALAITLHNIPEGFAVALPVYYSTGKKWKGFLMAGVAGFAEPLGALFAWAVLGTDINDMVLGVTMGAVAGIMTCLAIQELMPHALRDPLRTLEISTAFLIGMSTIAFSIVVIEFIF